MYYNDGRVKQRIETHAAAPANDPQARVTNYAYDARGRVLTTTAGGRVTNFKYDKLDRLVEERGPDGTHIKHFYNTNSQEYRTETFAFAWRRANRPVAAVGHRPAI